MPDTKLPALSELISLSQRGIVVTGAGAGIGRATALRLAEAGARVLVTDIDAGAAQQTRGMLGGAGHLAVPLDVTDSGAAAAVADQAVAAWGALDGWVNVAGIYPACPTLDLSDADWQRILSVNLSGSFYGAREAARRMIETNRQGTIVNTLSTSAFKVPGPGIAAYAASKGGLDAVTRAMAVEFGGAGLRVLSVNPTLTVSEGSLQQKQVIEAQMGGGVDFHEAYGRGLPLGRIPVADEVARVILFAMSDLAVMMTGCALAVDGGDLIS